MLEIFVPDGTVHSISLSCAGKCPGVFENVYAPLDPSTVSGCEARDGELCIDPTTIDSPYSGFSQEEFQASAQVLQSAASARPSPGHFTLAAEAALLAAASSTWAVMMRVVDGEAVNTDHWSQDFRSSAVAAAATVTPLGAHLLRRSFALDSAAEAPIAVDRNLQQSP